MGRENVVKFDHLDLCMSSRAFERPDIEPFSVLLLGNFLSGAGGRLAVCEELAGQLESRGWQVLRASARLNRLARLWDMLHTAWTHRGRYRAAHVDVFSGSAFVWAELACGLLVRTGCPFLLTLHGGSLPHFARRWPRRVSRLLMSADAVTSPSPYLCEELRRYRGDILLVPNALDLSRYEFRPRLQPQPRLIWLRSFHRIYNPLMAVEAFALITLAAPEARLTMIGADKGDGSFDDTRNLARELGVADRVSFIRGVPKAEVPARLHDGDVLLNTSITDNTPVSVMEAMACGLCVVSTDSGGLRYLIQDGNEGLLTTSGDAQGMANAVMRILNDSQLATKLSCGGRRKIEEFDWPAVLPQWESLFAGVARSFC